MAEPLTDAYLAEAEMRARQFSGAYTGTSGTLAADVLRILNDYARLKGELAVERANHHERRQYWQEPHD